MRRSGSTAQSVSAATAWPSGLRNGARSHCIRKRSSAVYTSVPKTTFSRKRSASESIRGSSTLLAQDFADLLRAPGGGLDRGDDRRLDSSVVERRDRALGSAALGSHLRAQQRRL